MGTKASPVCVAHNDGTGRYRYNAPEQPCERESIVTAIGAAVVIVGAGILASSLLVLAARVVRALACGGGLCA